MGRPGKDHSMLRIILFKGQSQYGSLRLHIDQLAAALTTLGHEAVVIDLVLPTAFAQLQAALARPVHFVYAFNSMGVDLAADGRSLYDQLDCLFLTLHVDHPIHLWERLQTPLGRRYVVSFLDRSHVDLARRAFPADHFGALSFMPPGANTAVPPVAPDAGRLFPSAGPSWAEQRDIPLLFTGTYRGAPQRPWHAADRNFVTTLFDDAADLTLSQDTLSVEDAFDTVLNSRGVDLAPAGRTALITRAREVYQYVEAERRQRLLHSLDAAGVRVVVYGKGWEGRPFPAFDWRGEGSFEETLTLLRRTRLVLNSNNNFVAGGHERVFAAQINGAAVLSDTSRFYQDAFQDGHDILLYRWTALDGVPGIIRDALNAPDRLAGIARNGFEKTARDHSWEARARHIVGLFEAAHILGRD